MDSGQLCVCVCVCACVCVLACVRVCVRVRVYEIYTHTCRTNKQVN